MKKKVILNRIDLTNVTVPLEDQISNLCEVNFAAGYELASTFVFGSNLILIFRLL